jgi:tetratricopeptide (TPR) repeat protein
MAESYRFLGEYENAINVLEESITYAPERNDSYWAMAWIYQSLKDWSNMYRCTSIMMNSNRKNAFPRYVVMIDTSIYCDSPTGRVQELHKIAYDNFVQSNHRVPINLYINKSYSKKLFVVDNFYQNPDEVREFALKQEYKEDLRFYKGLRSTQIFHPRGIKEEFERIIGEKITDFPLSGINGCFQITTSNDPQVYHHDLQKWAAMIYLTPNAPYTSGTRLHRSKINGTMHISEPNIQDAFSGGFYDSSKFDTIADAGNLYNRLVIMDAQNIHSAGPYFGQNMEDGRLTHLFFFD